MTLDNNLLTFRFTVKKFKLKRALSKMTTIENYNADFANLPDKKLLFDFAKGMYFNEKA